MSDHQGTPISTAARRLVSAAADPASPLDCPTNRWAARRHFGPRRRGNALERGCALPYQPAPREAPKAGTGAAALCPCRECLPPHNPLLGVLRIADAPAGSAAVPLLSRVLCGLSSLLVSVWNVLP